MPTRREMLEQLAAAALAVPSLRVARGALAATAPRLALPSAAQRDWLDLELGMFVHFAPNTWQEKEYDDLSLAPADIMPTIEPAQWADTALALGARYIVLVAKHAGGFCLWQTDTTDYSIKGTPWRAGRGDVMAELSEACISRGLKLGVYLSPRDDRHGAGLSGKCATPEAQGEYNTLYRQQLTELLTRYGAITELWLDGSSVVPTGDLVSQHAPGAMVFQGPQATIRWVGNEDGFAPYPCWNALEVQDAGTGVATALHGDPEGDAWMPVEVDVSMRRPNWFWSTTNDKNLLSLDALLEIYYRSIGRGAQLLLNLTPDRTGRIPAADANRAGEFGDEIRRRFGHALSDTANIGRDVSLSFSEPQRVDHVILQEEVGRGERVRAWRLDGMSWGHWQQIAAGTAMGHKQIVPIRPDGYTVLRLRVTDAVDEPVIRRFAAFNVGSAPPRTWRDPVTLWAEDAVGGWTGDSLTLDLTAKVPIAANYRLRLVAEDASVPQIRDIDLRVDQGPQPTLARLAPGRSDVVLIDMPVSGRTVTIRARVRGSPKGTALLRRL
jgi:alpha-L-fucosidase